MHTFNILIFGRMVAAVTALVGATYLASINQDGWGWLIFAAVLLGTVDLKVSSND